MNQSMTATKAVYVELLTRRSKFQDKKQSCGSLVASITSKLSGLEQAHSILEKRYLTDEATMQQVQASRTEIESERAKLSEAERLTGLAAEAIREIDQQALQEIAIAQRQFCAEQRNATIAKIREDADFRKNLIAAMVAHAGAGGSYTFSPPVFVEQFIHQLLPQISEAEVREAIDKFKKSNDIE